MNLPEELLSEHSKKQNDKIVLWVGCSAERFNQLMGLFFSEDYLLAQRAAWAVGIIASNNQPLFLPFLEKSIEKLQDRSVHDAVVRNILRIIQDIEIPEQLQSRLLDLCLAFIEDTKHPVAIRAFAISVLENICTCQPELSREISLVIMENMEFEKPAYKSRAKRFLKRFSATI